MERGVVRGERRRKRMQIRKVIETLMQNKSL